MLQHNFSRPHITNFMQNVTDFLQFRLAESAIGNEYLCCKQDFSIPPMLKDKSSLPTVKVSIDWVIGGIKTVCL